MAARKNNGMYLSEGTKLIQEQLAIANTALDKAKALADEHSESFEFFDRTYSPKKVVPGGWDNDKSDDHWNSSNC